MDKIAQTKKTEVVALPMKSGWLQIPAVLMKQREVMSQSRTVDVATDTRS